MGVRHFPIPKETPAAAAIDPRSTQKAEFFCNNANFFTYFM
jgi:hypothetical protein